MDRQFGALPRDLEEMKEEIEGYAHEVGLDFPEVRFVMLNFDEMNKVAAYDGFPSRYPHWRFGMEYERMRKSYAWGLHRIYEMVINTDPCYAYLLVSNLPIDQKLVMAHVYAHADFFKNNLWFAHTNRRMLDETANHGARIRRYVERYGLETVETFVDRCLSLENLIDLHSTGIRRQPSRVVDSNEDAPRATGRMPSKGYMEDYINPPDYLEEVRRQHENERQQERNFPAHPQRDVLLFLLEHAPLEAWQQDVLAIIREEAYYFSPQRQTKIMNEGWASYFHSHIMTRFALNESELIDYADHHSGTLATSPGRLNPYKVGIELFRHIEERWNRGAFGPDYAACEDIAERARWDKQLGLGREKIFEVRRIYNDIGFIETFLTPEFAQEQRLFTFAYNQHHDNYEIASREFEDVKRQLLFNLTNFGDPMIEVTDANYQNRGELYLIHHWDEVDLRVDYAEATLENLQAIWGRPVHLETVIGEKGAAVFAYDGNKHSRKLLQHAA
ncbi:MAG: SpoVR family protein [Caldilineaceae bacterium]